MVTVSCLALLCVGCGSTSDGPQLASVSGTVTFKGQPLENAQVVFIPEEVGAMPASGTTDKNGRYTLMTVKPGDGALIGKHRVMITARGPDKTLPESQNTTGMPGGNTTPGDPLIPEKYFNVATSELTAEVKPRGNSGTDFKLE